MIVVPEDIVVAVDANWTFGGVDALKVTGKVSSNTPAFVALRLK